MNHPVLNAYAAQRIESALLAMAAAGDAEFVGLDERGRSTFRLEPDRVAGLLARIKEDGVLAHCDEEFVSRELHARAAVPYGCCRRRKVAPRAKRLDRPGSARGPRPGSSAARRPIG